MHPDQIAVITRSFQELVPVEDALAALFYGRLFTLEPSLRPMFGADMRMQGRKFREMLHLIVGSLHAHELLAHHLQACGEQHRSYGVRAEHYAAGGAALLWALQQSLNERYTPDVAQAWAALYDLIASAMEEPPVPMPGIHTHEVRLR